MKVINFEEISELNISPNECVNWVQNAFLLKDSSYLPPKYSLKLPEDIFINTMPSYIPELGLFGVKVVSRYPNNIPALDSTIMLFDVASGKPVALMDGNWITAMRTGAVAALAIEKLEKVNTTTYGLMGLGNTARATVLCMINHRPERTFHFKLLNYKNQELLFIDRFKEYNNVTFEIVASNESLIRETDVIISCITSANAIIGEDSWFKKGVLVVPVHTRGFQNCDLFFEKIVVDDTNHVIGFKNFNHFKQLYEFHTVLQNINQGRESSEERILAYNIGIAIHDIYFAGMINRLYPSKASIEIEKGNQKFWV
jgi:ornithine cyclodeaminase/alanine dehydrogenase-like protein (mu-crystallin family)